MTSANRSIPVFLAGLAGLVLLDSMLTAWGWGTWGSRITGDSCIDLSDAMLRALGQIPYRDYLPVFGALPLHLMAPFFCLGPLALSSLWIATAVAIGAQAVCVSALSPARRGSAAAALCGAAFLVLCAFAPGNAKFIMGYSQAGFVSSLVWTSLLFLLAFRPRAGVGVGFLLGLQLFTKVDHGVVAVGVFGFLLVVGLAKRRGGVKPGRLLLGAVASILLMLALLLIQGANPRFLGELIWEAFATAGRVRDPALARRFFALAVALVGWTWVLATGSGRRGFVLLRRPLALLFLFGLPLAVVGDALRTGMGEALKDRVFLNYYFCVATGVIAARHASLLLLRSSIRGLTHRDQIWKVAATLIGLGGMARAANAGWYPLNYYQPALVLCTLWALGSSWRVSFAGSRGGATAARAAWAFCAILLAFSLARSIRSSCPSGRMLPLTTPWGRVLVGEDEPVAIYQRLISERGDAAALFVSHMPSGLLLSGQRTASLYTYYSRVGLSNYPLRDRHGYEFFHRMRPRHALVEGERAAFLPRFGRDFGLEIAAEITADYRPVLSHPGSGANGVITLWERRDARPGNPDSGKSR